MPENVATLNVKNVRPGQRRVLLQPVVVDPGLPEARALLVLLRSQRGVAEVAEQIRELLAEGLLYLRRARDQVSGERFGQHGARGLSWPSGGSPLAQTVAQSRLRP